MDGCVAHHHSPWAGVPTGPVQPGILFKTGVFRMLFHRLSKGATRKAVDRIRKDYWDLACDIDGRNP